MTAGFYGMLQGKPAVIDRRYSRKARVDGIDFVNELPTQDTSVRRSLSRAEGAFPEVVNSVLDGNRKPSSRRALQFSRPLMTDFFPGAFMTFSDSGHFFF